MSCVGTSGRDLTLSCRVCPRHGTSSLGRIPPAVLPAAPSSSAPRLAPQPSAPSPPMGDKYAGGLAGGGAPSAGAELADAAAGAALHETLVPSAGPPLRVVVSRRHGGAALAPVDPAAAARSAIAASQMRSMLADSHRCSKYNSAIAAAVAAAAVRAGRPPRVVDIGAGTGLLAMFAARAGAGVVDAVEMFQPIADVARQVVSANALDAVCTVYGGAKSTAMSVEEEDRYDLVVHEIVDSALLGEGILPVLAHARERLLKPDAASVPASATLFAQLVESPALFAHWHDLDPPRSAGPRFPFFRSPAAQRCNGGSRVFPVHLAALPPSDRAPLSDPFEVFAFDFSRGSPPQARNTILEVPATRAGVPHAVVLWWDLDLTGDGTEVYSTRPGAEPWQDHWLQGVFPLPRAADTRVETGHVIRLHAGHTDSEFYVSLTRARSPRLCSCGFHSLRATGPARLAALGDGARMDSLRRRTADAVHRCAKKRVRSRARGKEGVVVRVLDVSTASSVAGLLAAEAGHAGCFVDVTSLETEDDEDSIECLLYRQVSAAIERERQSALENQQALSPASSFTMVYSMEELQDRASEVLFDILVAEPYHPSMSNYPTATAASTWLRRAALATLLAPEACAVPARCSIRAQALSFAPGTLQTNFAPAGTVCGLDHSALDNVIAAEHTASGVGHEMVSLPLYMYETEQLSDALEVYDFSFADMPPDGISAVKTLIPLTTSGRLEAIAVWAEYDGEAIGRMEHVEVLWLNDRPLVEVGNSIELDCRWDRQGEGGFGFRISSTIKG